MHVTRNTLDTNPGPGDWFTGSVYIDTIAAPTRVMTHVAIQQVDETGSPVTWGEHVTDDQYAQAPTLEGSDR